MKQSPISLATNNHSTLISYSTLYLFYNNYHILDFNINVQDQGSMHSGSDILLQKKLPPNLVAESNYLFAHNSAIWSGLSWVSSSQLRVVLARVPCVAALRRPLS